MRIRRSLLAATLATALLASSIAGTGVALAAPPLPSPDFIRLFDLPAPPRPTLQQIADLAQTMLDPNADTGDNPATTSGFTYSGQFLDHDLTLDLAPSPLDTVDPTTLTNNRTFAFDLDSVYGAGPTDPATAKLYDARGKFRLAEPNVNGVLDYPRLADGTAIINESRNDENRIIAQIQLAFMKAHNRLVDSGLSFVDARRTLVEFYQTAIVNDFLPHLLSPVSDKNVRELTKMAERKPGGTPIEFSVAAYRFGHSQVRRAYVINEASGKVQVFSLTAPDLRGGSPLPANRVIDWSEFFGDLPNVNTDGNIINLSRRIDTLISSSLFVLPIPGAEASGSNVLAYRNMVRGSFYDLPSGETVAKALGVPVVPVTTGPGFGPGNTPLWYYILAESQAQTGGTKLGTVGSTIVAAGFTAALHKVQLPGKVDKAQLAALRGPDGATLSDIFVFAGVAHR